MRTVNECTTFLLDRFFLSGHICVPDMPHSPHLTVCSCDDDRFCVTVFNGFASCVVVTVLRSCLFDLRGLLRYCTFYVSMLFGGFGACIGRVSGYTEF